MEPREYEFRPETGKLSREMQETMKRTEAALQAMWARERIEQETVYEISIPPQKLTIYGKEHFDHALKTLKGLKVSGTYRVATKGGANEGNRAERG